MLERCFPWIGVLHDAASRYLGPGVYLDSRWRSPEVADRVWRAMTPKGFAAMWCCRCVTGVLQTNCFRTRNGPAEYYFRYLVRSRHPVRSTIRGSKCCGYRRGTGARTLLHDFLAASSDSLCDAHGQNIHGGVCRDIMCLEDKFVVAAISMCRWPTVCGVVLHRDDADVIEPIVFYLFSPLSLGSLTAATS
ncbi:hypothetical protein TcYC6_0102910 [Trypanosoma cruzi]|nr:hypothetical protein TcYC6_0102910 [Trypanosoma cruzi]